MSTKDTKNGGHDTVPGGVPVESHYRRLWRRTTLRLLFIYLSPVVVLSIYFLYQYDAIVDEGQRLHLKAVAESQANTLDLFLFERRVNLANLIENPSYHFPEPRSMERALEELRKVSDAFVDIGFFDSTGVQIAYSGPYPALEKRSYRD